MLGQLRATFCIILGASCFSSNGQAQGVPRKPPPLTVCEALSRRLELDGKIVTIRGHVTGTMEGAWLDSSACPGVVRSDNYVWPSMIVLENTATAKKIHPIDFSEDRVSSERVNRKYSQFPKGLPDRCVEFVFTGQLGTKQEFEALVYKDGSSLYLGFGHLNAAPAQLVLRSTDDVLVVPGCR